MAAAVVDVDGAGAEAGALVSVVAPISRFCSEVSVSVICGGAAEPLAATRNDFGFARRTRSRTQIVGVYVARGIEVYSRDFESDRPVDRLALRVEQMRRRATAEETMLPRPVSQLSHCWRESG